MEKFILPEKWFIKGSEELRKYEKTILKGKCNCGLDDGDFYYYNLSPNLRTVIESELRTDPPKTPKAHGCGCLIVAGFILFSIIMGILVSNL